MIASGQVLDTPFGQVTVIQREDGLEDWSATLNLKAMGKPTMTQASKSTKKAAVKYLTEFCPSIRAGFNRTAQFQRCQELKIVAFFKTSDKKLHGKRFEGKPDATNIQKGVEDALLIDDSHNDAACFRIWSWRDRIDIYVFGVYY